MSACQYRQIREKVGSSEMPRPEPTRIFHFTHLDHLPTVVSKGLLCDAAACDLLSTEVGNRQIKEQRRRRKVSVGTSGVVADYVPFYFAPRSPMLNAIVHGRVPEYTEGQDPIVYLVSTVERLVDLKLDLVFTDRNAALSLAKFSTDVEALDHLVDWSLMNATYWNNTIEYPDRRERRMAECLVHRSVPWEAFIGVATLDEGRRADAEEVLAAVGSVTPVKARPSWYF